MWISSFIGGAHGLIAPLLLSLFNLPRSEKEFVESDLEENAGDALVPNKTKNEVDVSLITIIIFSSHGVHKENNTFSLMTSGSAGRGGQGIPL